MTNKWDAFCHGLEQCAVVIIALAVIVLLLHLMAQIPGDPGLQEWEDRTRG